MSLFSNSISNEIIVNIFVINIKRLMLLKVDLKIFQKILKILKRKNFTQKTILKK